MASVNACLGAASVPVTGGRGKGDAYCVRTSTWDNERLLRNAAGPYYMTGLYKVHLFYVYKKAFLLSHIEKLFIKAQLYHTYY